MEDLFPLLIFLFVIFGPLIERVLRRGKTQEPPEEPPQQRPRPQQRPPLRERTPPAEAEGREGSAAEMLPDDLWAILTGEKRPERAETPQRPAERPPPQRVPAPQPSPQAQRRPQPPPQAQRRPDLPARRPIPGRPAPSEWSRPQQRPAPSEAPASLEEGTRRPMPPREPPIREEYVREIPRYDAPAVVSMEDTTVEAPLLEEHARHARFHSRLAGLAAPATVQKGPRARGHAALNSRLELRRAIILREILGPPRGLD